MYNKIILLIAVSAATILTVHSDAFPENVSGKIAVQENIEIAYDHYRNGFPAVIIVSPGFYNSKDNRWMRKTAEFLSSSYDVIVFDPRGHGSSSGEFMWTSREDADVAAVIRFAEDLGYAHIGILGYSLGASAAINAVAEVGGVESMVLISSVSRFGSIDFHFWEPGMFSDLFDNIACGWQGKGARCGNIFLSKKYPIDSVKKIKDTSILFIHGEHDWIVKPRHSKKLYEAASCTKELKIVKNGLHAERLIQLHYELMEKVILDWFAVTIKNSRSQPLDPPLNTG
ncbi:MAG: alpha/beta hydrolase [Candidatus Omnitrophica bacterium]|nr:alpha/beta hydrolase [Candidatus Omnitrophota bacterium]MDD4012821.1 alpha/beta hydrolase [Candidatus Omnitrophota bacterium]